MKQSPVKVGHDKEYIETDDREESTELFQKRGRPKKNEKDATKPFKKRKYNNRSHTCHL
jgi:hypothetical protein